MEQKFAIYDDRYSTPNSVFNGHLNAFDSRREAEEALCWWMRSQPVDVATGGHFHVTVLPAGHLVLRAARREPSVEDQHGHDVLTSDCWVCGDDRGVKYSPSRRMALCPTCLSETPVKVDRETFEAAYWNVETKEIPESVRAEFYDDYLRSSDTLARYCGDTRGAVGEDA